MHFQIKYTEAILSNSTRNLLRLEMTVLLIAVKKNKFIVLFAQIFGTLSFPIHRVTVTYYRRILSTVTDVITECSEACSQRDGRTRVSGIRRRS